MRFMNAFEYQSRMFILKQGDMIRIWGHEIMSTIAWILGASSPAPAPTRTLWLDKAFGFSTSHFPYQ